MKALCKLSSSVQLGKKDLVLPAQAKGLSLACRIPGGDAVTQVWFKKQR